MENMTINKSNVATAIEVKFAKVRKDAIIPSKRLEDAGYDIYANFEEDYIEIKSGEIKFIPTGIASAIPIDYYMQFQERGSTGSKGLSARCGVIDSNYRGEWKVPINNTTNKTIIIAKNIEDFDDDKFIVYPYTKAICQALLLPVPRTIITEITYEELQKIESDRGLGMLGSSGK